jgi:hypothetical protein
VVADAVRIQQIEGDHGLDDDFRVLPEIADDRCGRSGREYSWFLAEPAPHGGRVNLGHTGNTARPLPVRRRWCKSFLPTAGRTHGRPTRTEITWRSAGLLDTEVVGLINVGGLRSTIG